MAKTGRHTTSRRSSQSMYVDGNTVRKVQEVPVKKGIPSARAFS